MPTPAIETAEELFAKATNQSSASAPAEEQAASQPGAERAVLGDRAGALKQADFFRGGLSAREAAEIQHTGDAEETHHAMIDPEGKIVLVPETQVRAALGADYLPAGAKQKSDFYKEVEHHRVYGGVAGGVLAGTTGVLKGLSLGLGNLALAKTGAMPAEEQAAVKEENEGIFTAGDLVGSALPIVLSGGAAAAPEAVAGVAGKAGVGRALGQLAVGHSGQALEAAVKAALPTATGTLGKAAVKGISMGVGAGAEGALFSAGNVVHEAALGDPKLTAESAMSEIGLGTLFGAGLGLVGGAGSELMKPVLSKARSAIGSVANAAEELGIKLSSKISGVEQNTLRELKDAASLELRDPKARETMATKLAENLNASRDAIEEAGGEFAGSLRGKDLARHLDHVDDATARAEALRLSETIDAKLKDFASNPERWDMARISELDDLSKSLKKLSGQGSSTAREIFEKINDVKGNLWSLQRYTGAPGSNYSAEKTAHAIGDLWRGTKDSLENEGVWGSAGKRLSEMNEAFSAYRADFEDFGKEFGRQIRTPTGKKSFEIDAKRINSFLTQAADARGSARMETLTNWLESGNKYLNMVEESAKATGASSVDHAALRRVIDATSEQVAEARKRAAVTAMLNPPKMSFGTGGLPGGGGHSPFVAIANVAGGNVLGGPVLAAAGGLLSAYKTLSDAPAMARTLAHFDELRHYADKSIMRAAGVVSRGSDAAFHLGRGEAAPGIASRFARAPELALAKQQKESDKLSELANDPRMMDEHLQKQTAGWSEHAPETADAVRSKIIRDVQFLNSKMPQTKTTGMSGLGLKVPPSPAEVAKANRYLVAYHNPVRELHKAAHGMLTPEGRETLKTCYPGLYQKACLVAIEKSQRPDGSPPSKATRQSLANLLGTDVDGSRSPRAVAANQAAYAKAAQKEQDKQNNPAPIAGASKLSLATRSASAWGGGRGK